jgi:hypothetical protein
VLVGGVNVGPPPPLLVQAVIVKASAPAALISATRRGIGPKWVTTGRAYFASQRDRDVKSGPVDNAGLPERDATTYSRTYVRSARSAHTIPGEL